MVYGSWVALVVLSCNLMPTVFGTDLKDSITACISDKVLDEIANLKQDNQFLLGNLTEYKERQQKMQCEIESMKRCIDCTGQFKQPGFMSDWFLMKSSDDKLSDITIEHGLGVTPYKVDVLVKAMDGPNEGWIFKGGSTFQTDDDHAHTYGGVVYLYNETHVRLLAPNKRNGVAVGNIICTGDEQRRLGPYHQIASSAMVLVKAWGPKDMAQPDFQSDWLPVDVLNKSTSYYELPHDFNDYPALVSVQVRQKNAKTGLTYISEGVGATVPFRDYLDGGGVVWGVSDYSIRMWTAFFPDQSRKVLTTYGKPIPSADGWGKSWSIGMRHSGSARILAWSKKTAQKAQDFIFGRSEKTHYEFGFEQDGVSPLDHDLLSISTEALNGPNEGFRFMGYGAAHGEGKSFGGTVFAYNASGHVRSWHPNVDRHGAYVNIEAPYGDGKNTQSSNEANFVMTLLKTRPCLF